MSRMEDSGFDSDSKTSKNGLINGKTEVMNGDAAKKENSALKMMTKASQLQQKLEKQREAARKAPGGPVTDQPKKHFLLSRNRLKVPDKCDFGVSDDMQPLVMIETDESEDEFAVPRLSKQAQYEITQQLIKDGYNLDLEPDDEDLDLIPPRPFNERCVCCQTPYAVTTSCVLQ